MSPNLELGSQLHGSCPLTASSLTRSKYQNRKVPPLIDSWLAALQTALGYRCYHPILWFCNIRDCAAWNAAQDAKLFLGKGKPLHQHGTGRPPRLSADPPAITFAPRAHRNLPPTRASSSSSERDVEACSMSFEQSDHPAVVEPVSEPPRRLGSVDHGPRAGYATHFQWIRGWFKTESKGEMPRDVYRDHCELVRRITPPDR